MKTYAAKFPSLERLKRLEKAMQPRDPWDITVAIEPLPSKDDRKHIEARDPGVEHIWLEPESKK